MNAEKIEKDCFVELGSLKSGDMFWDGNELCMVISFCPVMLLNNAELATGKIPIVVLKRYYGDVPDGLMLLLDEKQRVRKADGHLEWYLI